MCNLYTQSKSVDEVARLFREKQIPLTFPEGLPNLSPRDIAITDPGVIVRQATGAAGAYDLLVRRWSWPGAGGKPVYNFRSDGREFPSGRCLIIADGFYEFTASSDPRRKRKDRWLFTPSCGGMLGIAGLVRTDPGVGEAFTMLTTEPGPDVAPYHNRQIAVLPGEQWKAWLDYSEPSAELLKPLPNGSLNVELAPREASGPALV
jgi:putative SOS response-associated peptidase YedK